MVAINGLPPVLGDIMLAVSCALELREGKVYDVRSFLV